MSTAESTGRWAASGGEDDLASAGGHADAFEPIDEVPGEGRGQQLGLPVVVEHGPVLADERIDVLTDVGELGPQLVEDPSGGQDHEQAVMAGRRHSFEHVRLRPTSAGQRPVVVDAGRLGSSSRCGSGRARPRPDSVQQHVAARRSPSTRRVRPMASGFTETESMPKRTRASANAGRFDGACPHSDDVNPSCFAERMICSMAAMHGAVHLVEQLLADLRVAIDAEDQLREVVRPDGDAVDAELGVGGEPVDDRRDLGHHPAQQARGRGAAGWRRRARGTPRAPSGCARTGS